MKSFADVIALWDTATDLAREIGQKAGTVRQWRNRGAIPPEYWQAVIAAAVRCGKDGVTAEALTAMVPAAAQTEQPAATPQAAA